MSHAGITLPGPEDSGSSPLSFAAPPPIKVSFPFGQVVGALARAMMNIVPPVKNKHVQVDSRRTGRSYSYDYATLDVILEAVTKPLAEQGLILTQMPRDRRELDVLLLHSSGQWMMTEVPLMPKDDGFQDFTGAITAARRIGIQALLSISAEDDDDGNANAGNDIGDRHWDPEIEVRQDALHPFVRLARNATSVRHGCELLKAWPSRASEMAKLRRADLDGWTTIVAEFAKGLNATMGIVVSTAWRSALLAETPEQEAAIREKWMGEWESTLENFRSVEPGAFSDLMRHMNERRSEIEANARRAAAGTDAGTAGDTPQTGDGDADGDRAPSNRDAAIEAQRAPGEGFLRLVLDAQGDPATDEFTDPEAWAKAFAEIRGKTPLVEREAMDNHNMDAISDASAVIGADIVLREALEVDAAEQAEAELALMDDPIKPAEPVIIPVVEIPRNRSGAIDIARYVEALGSVIATLDTPEEIAQFIDLNFPRYTGEGVPLVVQSRVLKALASRKRALGIPLPSEA